MQLAALTTAKSLDWSGWILGLWTSAISSAAGAIAAGLGPMVTDPKDFNLGDGLHHTMVSIGIGAAITGIVSLAKYLQMHPAPDPVQLQQALADASDATAHAAAAIESAKAAAPPVE